MNDAACAQSPNEDPNTAFVIWRATAQKKWRTARKAAAPGEKDSDLILRRLPAFIRRRTQAYRSAHTAIFGVWKASSLQGARLPLNGWRTGGPGLQPTRKGPQKPSCRTGLQSTGTKPARRSPTGAAGSA